MYRWQCAKNVIQNGNIIKRSEGHYPMCQTQLICQKHQEGHYPVYYIWLQGAPTYRMPDSFGQASKGRKEAACSRAGNSIEKITNRKREGKNTDPKVIPRINGETQHHFISQTQTGHALPH